MVLASPLQAFPYTMWGAWVWKQSFTLVALTWRKRRTWKRVHLLRCNNMSSTSQGLCLEDSGHERTSLEQVAAIAVADEGLGEGYAAAAATTQMESEQGDSSIQLDGELWGSLPEDLQDRILAWLPFTAFARASTVCKRYLTVKNFVIVAFLSSSQACVAVPNLVIVVLNRWQIVSPLPLSCLNKIFQIVLIARHDW